MPKLNLLLNLTGCSKPTNKSELFIKQTFFNVRLRHSAMNYSVAFIIHTHEHI